jgi:hypothetical protein
MLLTLCTDTGVPQLPAAAPRLPPCSEAGLHLHKTLFSFLGPQVSVQEVWFSMGGFSFGVTFSAAVPSSNRGLDREGSKRQAARWVLPTRQQC